MKRRHWSRSFVRVAPISLIGGRFGSLIFIVISLSMLALSAIAPGSMSGIRTGVSDAFMPALAVINRPIQDAAAFVRSVSGLAELQADNTILRQENMRLREWYQTALLLEAENESLRDLMNVTPEPQRRYITARVLSDTGNNFVKSLVVSAGSSDGVKTGQAAISSDGVIGRVIETGRSFSRILLVTDINSRIPVLVEGNRLHAIMAGQNEIQPTLEHMPPGTKITEGARIVTSGYGGIFPPGLPIGRVINSNNDNYYVDLFTDFDHMVHVKLIERQDNPNLIGSK